MSALQFFDASRLDHRVMGGALPKPLLQFTKCCTIFTDYMEGSPIRLLPRVGLDPSKDKCKHEPPPELRMNPQMAGSRRYPAPIEVNRDVSPGLEPDHLWGCPPFGCEWRN